MEKKVIFEGTNILIVGKNKTTQNLFKKLFLECGDKVQFVNNREESLKIIKQIPFLIVIIDLEMLEADTLEFLKEIKEIDKNSCIIVVSDHLFVELTAEIMRDVVYDHISRPFDNERIKAIFRRAVERQYLLEEARQKKRYQQLSILDGLTNIYNYRYFHEIIEKEINRAKRYNQIFSLLMIDIDDFKKYNDTQGHLSGDKLLKQIALFLKETVRAADTVFRYGGDEFIILLPMIPKEQALKAAERLQNAIKQNFSLTISIGISSFPEDGKDKKSAIKKADLALYQAKHLGRNKICSYASDKSKRD